MHEASSQKTETQITPAKILQTGLAFWNSKLLLSAVELEIFTKLSGGPLDADDLIHHLNIHPRAARDFFDALVAAGFLRRENGRYSNTPETGTFLVKSKPSYIGGILEMSANRLYSDWGFLTEALKTGTGPKKSKSASDPFEKLYETPEKLKEFLSAMTGISMASNVEIGRKFDWKKYRSFVDVGAAQGGLAVQIALQNPHLSGTGYDLARVRPVFEEYVKSFGLSERLGFQRGDFFKEELPPADVIIMGHILHDWDLETKRMLIAKAHRALAEGGAFIVFESIIDDDRSKNLFGLLMSLNMLIETPGGFDFTGADCQRWMREAGFRETRVIHLQGPDSMVVGIK